MSKITKSLIAFLLMSCLLIMAVPAFAADDEKAEEIDGYAYLSIDFEGVEEVPFTSNNVEDLSVADGVFSGTSTSADPHMLYTPGVNFPADKVDYIIIKLAAESENSDFQFFFTTETTDWSEDASFKYDFASVDEVDEVDEADEAEDGLVTIIIETSTCPEWKGTITGFRLDPFSATGTFAFDSIVFWSTDTNIASVNFDDLAAFGHNDDVVQLFVEDGYLYGESAGGDPFMNYTETLDLDAANVGAINFRMKAFSENTSFQFFFTTETVDWSEAASFKVDLSECRKDAFGWIYVEIDTSECAEWKGKITGFRLDPFSSAGVFKFGTINFDVAVNTIPEEAAETVDVIVPPKVPAPVFDYGVMLYFLFDNLPEVS